MQNTTDAVYNVLADHLLERLDYIRIQPETILVTARHPEFIVQQLQKRYPIAVIQIARQIDEMSTFATESVDLIFSHFMLAQTAEPLVFLQSSHRVLKNEGLLLLTTLGPDTFFELRESFSQLDSYPHIHDFFDMHHAGDWLRGLHFADPVVDREECVISYDMLDLFFEDLKTSGVTNTQSMRSRGLMTKNKWMQMKSKYAGYQVEGEFPVTIEMIYGHGWKVKIAEDPSSDDEYVVPLNKIRRS